MTKGLHYSGDLEKAIIGACLLEKPALGRCYGNVEPKHFYFEDHQKIFGSLVEMWDQNIPIDIITLECYMMRKGITLHNANQYGNYSLYLCLCTNDIVSTAHLEYHSHVLNEMWKLRELERLTKSGLSADYDVRKQIGELTNHLNEIRGAEFKKEWHDMSELMVNLVKHQEEIKSGAKRFITTGFKRIDRLNGGFYDGQFIVIGARPSMGKSSLMGHIAVSMAKQGKRIGIISLEMNNTEIAGRLAALSTDFTYQTIFRNLFQDEQQQQRFYSQIANQVSELPIYVSDYASVDINDIKAKAAKLRAQYGCDCLIVDYLQLIETTDSKRNMNREQEVSKISRGLKLLAGEMKIPVIALCQLSREATKGGAKDRYPKPSHLRESGSLEQDADVIMMLHRDFIAGFELDENGNSTEFEADLLGQKWRNGALFHLKLEFNGERMRFREIEDIRGYIPVREISDHTESNKVDTPF